MNGPRREAAARFPRSPGVYLMKDRRGEILYVGKAKDLRARVRAYFAPSARHTAKTQALLSRVDQVDFMVTASESEAFILESNLIKKNRPRYNVILRDDKHYPYLRLTVQEDFPRLEVVRKIEKDGALYFGPYVPGSGLRATLDLIERTFPLRKCRKKVIRGDERPCLNYQIGRCLAPCAGKVSKAEYGRVVREVKLFLKGKNKELLQMLTDKMTEASGRLAFEQAAVIRDQIRRIEMVSEKQKIISPALEDKDVFGIAQQGEAACVEILFIRGGKLLGKRDYIFDPAEAETPDELLRQTVVQYYGQDRMIPPHIFFPVQSPEWESVAEALTALGGRRVGIKAPLRGLNVALVRMANENGALALDAYLQRKDRDRLIVERLQQLGGLSSAPRRIEAFDISNIQGEYPVASMVVFEHGRPLKRHYRHFKIRSVDGANDYAMMEEVLHRRYRPGDEKEMPMPDMILVDGGKGQLAVLEAVVRDLGLTGGPDLMALAKGRAGKGPVMEKERVFLPGRSEPVLLEPDDPVCHLLQRVRDESHRFAIAYYRKRHTRETLTSLLKGVSGIGNKRSVALLKHFGSLARVRQATLEELAQAPSMNREVASRVYDRLHSHARPS
ncbi:MAG: excinuclease ABC subunit UvrC [bacterium]|nr:excinuclease ABC subunit UvrC [bacterium]